MAKREELGIIRGARAGDAQCQLALGKLYLFGGASLPLSLPTALHWLNRAALQEQDEAWMLIGSHVPFEHAQHCLPSVLSWYDRAYEAGVTQAGLVLAQLVFNPAASAPARHHAAAWRHKATQALQAAVRAGSADALCLLSHQTANLPLVPETLAAHRSAPVPHCSARQPWQNDPSAVFYAMLEQSWQTDAALFLQQALPLLRTLLATAPADAEAARLVAWPLAPAQRTLLSRCAALYRGDHPERAALQQCRELAAYGGDRDAQLALGLWWARMQDDGRRQEDVSVGVNFKRAIRWLILAGEQGLGVAWYALSRIYLKPEFSQRCVAEAQGYLERAAELGHCAAQRECGLYAWRHRRHDPANEVRAAYWLQKAAAQGCVTAQTALARIVATPKPSAWAVAIVCSMADDALHSQPLLAARLELATLFGLSRAEALLLDVAAADHGHCLVVDIRAQYGRSKRRLVLLQTAAERHALDRIARLFEHIDQSAAGPEGNYRQRLYRLKTYSAACNG